MGFGNEIFAVYRVIYEGNLLPKFYIGSTIESKIILGKYFGSVASKRWKEIFKRERKDNPNLFKIEILSRHSSRKEAIEEELRIQILNDVVNSDDYINESLARVNGFFGRDVRGDKHPRYGKHCSEETRNKISMALKGKIESDSTKLKKSISKLGEKNSFYGKKHSLESRDEISKSKLGTTPWNRGIPMREESKIKLSESKIGKKASDETKQKLSKLRKGKMKSEETKENMRLAWVKRREKIKINNYSQFLESKLNDKIDLPEDIINISNAYINHGKDIFLVGGAVRDFINGIEPKDYDLVTNALPNESKEILKDFNVSDEQGKNFGVIRVYTKTNTEGYEIASYRKDISGGRDTKGEDQKVELGDHITIEDDCKRRDLTINALFYDIKNKKIIDLVGGINDIKNKIIKSVGDPNQRFSEDRLRILRIFRFAARINGKIDKETSDAIKNNNKLCGLGPKEDVSRERIWDEIKKSWHQSKDFKYYLNLLTEFNMWGEIFPKLEINGDIKESKELVVYLANILRDNNPQELEKTMINNLKIESDVTSKVCYLIRLLDLSPQNAFQMYKDRVKCHVTDKMISEWGQLSGIDEKLISAFIGYKPSVSAQDLMNLGYKGPQLGKEISRLEEEKFRDMI